MPSFSDPHILIIGAGPTGLSLALELARYGVAFRIIDKGAGPAKESRALAIQARTLELFDARGMADEFVAGGVRMKAMNLHGRHLDRIAHLSFEHLPTRFPYLLSFPQSETEKILTRHLENAGVHVEREVELLSLAPAAESVSVTLKTKEGKKQETFAWVVGCDGAHSTTRDYSGISFGGSDTYATFMLADLTIESDLPPDEAYACAAPHGILALFPLPGGVTRMITNASPETPLDKYPTLAECQKAVDAGAKGVTVTNMTWSSYFHIHTRMAEYLKRGRVLLVGDAAHIHSPALGQGMNTGIQDAINLAWKLAQVHQGLSHPSIVESYESERQPVEHGVLRETEAVTRIMTDDHPMLTAIRDDLIHFASHISALKDRLALLVSQLGVHYGRSAVVGGSSNGDVQPGQRAPDVSIDTTDGRGRTYEFLRTPAHLVLLFAEDSSLLPERVKLRDALASRYGRFVACKVINEEMQANADLEDAFGDAEVVLIRPDGYVGFIGEIKEFNAYLHGLFDGVATRANA